MAETLNEQQEERQLPEPLPELELPRVVSVSASPEMRLSPNDIRHLKAETGRTLTELTGESADEADQMQTMTWLKLRREGLNVSWSDCADIAVDFQGEAEPLDPTSNGSSKESPSSAGPGT